MRVAEGRGDLTRGEEPLRFPCRRWLERCDGCGGEVQADLCLAQRPDEGRSTGVRDQEK